MFTQTLVYVAHNFILYSTRLEAIPLFFSGKWLDKLVLPYCGILLSGAKEPRELQVNYAALKS
jgi:hypothetical protein